MRRICDEGKCTACGACVQACPKKCIEKIVTKDASFYYSIDEKKCISCKKCERVCPGLNLPIFNKAKKSYAAWRTDSTLHFESASGGIATAFYEYAVTQKMFFSGVSLNDKFEAHFKLTNQVEDIKDFKNSKYTFSFASDIFDEILDKLKCGYDVLFIGLPCQVAAIKNLVRITTVKGNLITVDLVCHGTPPPIYLQQHIKAIELKQKQKFTQCFFRDAKFDTSNYAYTLYTHNSEKPTYVKYVDDNDNYQIGYHNALIYREVCYNCMYAKRERVGDLTIGDYHGLGKLKPYNHEKINVSCLVVNSDLGMNFLDEVQKKVQLTLYERPLTEPMEGEHQFNQPSVAPKERKKFIELYGKYQDFEIAADNTFYKFKQKNVVMKLLHVKQIKLKIMKAIPRCVKEQGKAFIRRIRG